MSALLAAPEIQKSVVVRLKQSIILRFDGGKGTPTRNNKKRTLNLDANGVITVH